MQPSRSPDATRILIVRPTAMGDVSRTVPALVSLRKALPDARIDWLVSSGFADVLAGHRMLDGLVLFDRATMSSFGYGPRGTKAGFQLARWLHQQKYDRVYDLQGLLRSGLFTWLTRAKHRVGFANAREGAWMFYNQRHALDARMHTVDRMLGLLKADGIEPVADMQLYLSGEQEQSLAELLQTQQTKAMQYMCMAPTAKWLCKCWPSEKYAAVIRWLISRQYIHEACPLFLLAAPSEAAQVTALIAQASQQGIEKATLEKCVRPLQTNVGQMMGLLSQCKLLLCNDSAALHIGVGFKRKIVTMFGPTDPSQVGPYSDSAIVLQPTGITAEDMSRYRKHRDNQSLIARIKVETVCEAAEKQLTNH